MAITMKTRDMLVISAAAFLYILLLVYDHHYARSHNVSFYAGVIGWIVLAPLYGAIVYAVLRFMRRKK